MEQEARRGWPWSPHRRGWIVIGRGAEDCCRLTGLCSKRKTLRRRLQKERREEYSTYQQVVSNETELAEAEDENTVESSGAIKLKSSVEEQRKAKTDIERKNENAELFYSSIKSPVLEPVKLIGEEEYILNVLKEINVTESYLGLDQVIRYCDEKESLQDCKTKL